MREIVFDTETTGLSPLNGDRLVEIGCVEVINYIPTDKQLHLYINPERDMPPGAFAVILLATGWVWLGIVIAVGLLVLKCVSLGWLLQLGMPVPERDASSA